MSPSVIERLIPGFFTSVTCVSTVYLSILGCCGRTTPQIDNTTRLGYIIFSLWKLLSAPSNPLRVLIISPEWHLRCCHSHWGPRARYKLCMYIFSRRKGANRWGFLQFHMAVTAGNKMTLQSDVKPKNIAPKQEHRLARLVLGSLAYRAVLAPKGPDQMYLRNRPDNMNYCTSAD